MDGIQRENVLPEKKCSDQHGRNVDSSSSLEVDKVILRSFLRCLTFANL